MTQSFSSDITHPSSRDCCFGVTLATTCSLSIGLELIFRRKIVRLSVDSTFFLFQLPNEEVASESTKGVKQKKKELNLN